MNQSAQLPMNRRRATQVVAALALGSSGLAGAQSFPARPVKIIVPYGPGTVSDLSARMLAERLSELWGQGVVVENQTGAGGAIGTHAIVRAPADGYTLGLLASNHAMNAALYQNLPYDAVKDFKFLFHTSYNQFALCAHPSFPARDLAHVIELAKERPDHVTYGSSGNGGSPHLAMAKLAHMAKIRLTHIPYKSNGAGVTDLISGQIMLMATSVSVLAPHVKAGKLRALAVTGETRSPLLPDTPTVAEAGVKGYALTNWNGLVGPAGMPEAVASKIRTDIQAVLKDPRTVDKVAALGAELAPLDGPAFERKVLEEIASWREVVKAAGVKAD